MLEFIASAGFWSLGILGFGLGAFVCMLRGLGGRDALRALGLHLTGVSLLIGFGGTAVGFFKHHHVVGEGPPEEQVARLAGVLGITLSAVGLAALTSAVNLLLYGIGTWRARRSEGG